MSPQPGYALSVGGNILFTGSNFYRTGGSLDFYVDGGNIIRYLDSGGGSLRVGYGTTPQGMLHAHDGTGGMMFVSKTGIGATPVLLIPNGTGDCTRGLVIVSGVARISTGENVPIYFSWRPNNSAGTLVSDGANSFALAVNVDGSVTVYRTGGTTTLDLSLLLIWQ